AVAEARAARAAEPLIMLLHLEEAHRPAAHVAARGDQRPVEVLHRIGNFGGEAGGRDRARVPADRGGGALAVVRRMPGLLERFATLLVGGLLVVRHGGL